MMHVPLVVFLCSSMMILFCASNMVRCCRIIEARVAADGYVSFIIFTPMTLDLVVVEEFHQLCMLVFGCSGCHMILEEVGGACSFPCCFKSCSSTVVDL